MSYRAQGMGQRVREILQAVSHGVVYRDTSLIRHSNPPWDHHMTLGIILL